MKQWIIFFVLALACSLAGQAAPPCNQRECKAVPTVEFVSAVMAQCGAGLTVTVGLVTYAPKDGACPSYVITVPAHTEIDTGHLKPDAHAVDGSPYEVTKQEFACKACGFLWLSTCCEKSADEIVVNVLFNCAQAPCRPASPAQL
jgi:hypothetical protein